MAIATTQAIQLRQSAGIGLWTLVSLYERTTESMSRTKFRYVLLATDVHGKEAKAEFVTIETAIRFYDQAISRIR